MGFGSYFRHIRVSDKAFRFGCLLPSQVLASPIAVKKNDAELILLHARRPYVEPKEAQDSKGARRSGARQDEPKEA